MTGTNKEFGSTEKTVKAPGRPVDLNGPIDLDGPSGATMMEVSFAQERQTGLWHWVMVLVMTGVLVVMGVNTFFPPERPPLRTAPPAATLFVHLYDSDGWREVHKLTMGSMTACALSGQAFGGPEGKKWESGISSNATCVAGE